MLNPQIENTQHAVGDGYSLWYLSDEETPLHQRLQTLIRDIATDHHSFVFPPHITLLSDIKQEVASLQTKAEILTSRHPAFSVRLGAIDTNYRYFQMLFSRVTPSPQLLRWHDAAEELYDVRQSPYFPHLSFAYGNFPDRVIDQLKGRLSPLVTPELVFPVTQIQIWKTIGTVPEWEKIATYPLKDD